MSNNKDKHENHLDDFFNCYRGRYLPKWVHRFGMIPNLPASFDNSNDTYELLAWLQRGFKQLLDDFLNLELEFEEFKNAVLEMIEALVVALLKEFIQSKEFYDRIFEIIRDFIQTEEFKQKVIQIIREWVQSDEFKQIINKYISSWYDENVDLSDIYARLDYLESLLNQEYTELTPGTDYDITFFNGFHADNSPIKIGAIKSNKRFNIHIEGARLQNPSLKNARQEHGYTPSVEPNSVIFALTFKGDYAEVNTGTAINSRNNGSGTFNVNPLEARASWNAAFDVYTNDVAGGSRYPFVFVLRSYNDGFNNQFADDYPSYNLVLNTGLFLYDLTIDR